MLSPVECVSMFGNSLWGRGEQRRALPAILASSLVALGLAVLPGCSGRKPDAPAAVVKSDPAKVSAADAPSGPAGPAAEAPAPPPAVISLRLDAAELQPGARLSGAVSGSWGKDTVRLLWVDGLGRVAADFELKSPDKDAAEVPFSLARPNGVFGQRHQLLVVRAPREALRKSARERTPAVFTIAAQAPFRVLQPARPWDDYLALLGDGCGNADPAFWRGFAQAGLSGGLVVALEPGTELVRRGLPFFSNALPLDANPLRLSSKWTAQRDTYVASRGRKALERQPPLFDDQSLAAVRSAIEKSITAKNAPPLGWSLGERLSLAEGVTPFDYDMSPATLDVFRLWLEDAYGPVAALNRQWGTEYKSWTDVLPPTTDEAKADHNPLYADGLKAFLQPPPTPPADGAEAPAPPLVRLGMRGGVRGFTLAPEQVRAPGRENFSAWSDWRTFCDFAFARLLREYRAMVRQAAGADAAVGLMGAEPPSAWGGWDYSSVARSLDWVEEHRSVVAREMFRSFAPAARALCAFSTGQPDEILRLWDRWLRGDAGCILQQHHWRTPPDHQPAPDAKAFLSDLRRLGDGLTLLRNTAQPAGDAVALYYSPRSFQLHWMLDSEADGSWWLNRDSVFEDTHSSALLQMRAWLALLEDLGYAPRFVSPAQLLAGELWRNPPKNGAARAELTGVKVLILPKVLSLSDDEADALRRFTRAGGVVIADGACGVFDGHGKRRQSLFAADGPLGVLDRDFGLGRRDLRLLESNGAWLGDDKARVALRSLVPDAAQDQVGPESAELRVLEPGIVPAGARSHGVSAGGAAALLAASAGRGRFLYLNLAFQDYPELRERKNAGDFRFRGMSLDEYAQTYGQPTGGEALRLLIGDILSEVLPENSLRVRALGGTPLRGIRRVAFSLGRDASLVALIPVGGTLSPAAGTEVWAGLERVSHWYDVRGAAYLGCKTMVKVTLEPHRPQLLVALPYRVERLSLKIRRADSRGVFKVTAAVVLDSGDAGTHVFHAEISGPDGQVLPHYSRNIVVGKGRWSAELALALNEPAGVYQLTVRDVLTGKLAVGALAKDAAEYTSLAPAK